MLSPKYRYMCTAIIGRAYSAMVIGANNGTKYPIQDTHITVTDLEMQFQLSNSGYTCTVMFIYQ